MNLKAAEKRFFIAQRKAKMNIEQYLQELIKREGGYVNNPADRGGATKFGITEAVARASGFKAHMRGLLSSVAKDIYRNNTGLATI